MVMLYSKVLFCSCWLGTRADLEDTASFEVKSLKQAVSPNDPKSVQDLGIIPGDRRGGAGYDSSLFT